MRLKSCLRTQTEGQQQRRNELAFDCSLRYFLTGVPRKFRVPRVSVFPSKQTEIASISNIAADLSRRSVEHWNEGNTYCAHTELNVIIERWCTRVSIVMKLLTGMSMRYFLICTNRVHRKRNLRARLKLESLAVTCQRDQKRHLGNWEGIAALVRLY